MVEERREMGEKESGLEKWGKRLEKRISLRKTVVFSLGSI